MTYKSFYCKVPFLPDKIEYWLVEENKRGQMTSLGEYVRFFAAYSNYQVLSHEISDKEVFVALASKRVKNDGMA